MSRPAPRLNSRRGHFLRRPARSILGFLTRARNPLMPRRTPLALPFLAAALSLPAAGAPPTDADMLGPSPHPKGYVCYRAPSPVVIDGTLKEAAWDAAPWSEPFADIEGDRRPKPRFRTRVKMLWDDEALYVAAELEEPHLWATLKEHDAVIFHDNDFEVFLDPDGDNHLYGELECGRRSELAGNRDPVPQPDFLDQPLHARTATAVDPERRARLGLQEPVAQLVVERYHIRADRGEVLAACFFRTHPERLRWPNLCLA